MLTRKIYEKFYNQNLNIIWKDYLNSKEKTESKSSKKWMKILIPLVGIGGFASRLFGGSGGDDHIELTERVDKEIPTKEVIKALENWS